MADTTSNEGKAPAFDETYDIVVIGYGFAGALAAITAADSGARVLLAEKESTPGGILICSGGGEESVGGPDERKRRETSLRISAAAIRPETKVRMGRVASICLPPVTRVNGLDILVLDE